VPADYVFPTPEPAFTPAPADAYPVPEGLRIVFGTGGDIWLWKAGTRSAERLTSVGDDLMQVKISDNGQIVAFRKADELWMVHGDGTGERILLGAENLEALASDGFEVRLGHFAWVPGTHTVAFNTRKRLEARDVPADDLCLVEASALGAEHPTGPTLLLQPGDGGEFTYSPDGGRIAVVTPGDVSLVDADGTNRRDRTLTYTPIATHSGDARYVRPVWASDGSELMVAVPPPDPDARPLQQTTIWRIPIDGAPAELVATINALPTEDTVSFSSLLTYVAFGELLQAGDSEAEVQVQLKVARLGTDDWQAYPEASALFGWAPDSRRFAFVSGRDRPQLLIGQWSGGTIPGSIDAGISVEGLRWVDRDHYVFVARRNGALGAEEDTCDLILADVSGASTLIASTPHSFDYDLARASADAGQGTPSPIADLCSGLRATPTDSSTVRDRSDWQVFRHAERGFRISYPDSWRLEAYDSWVGVGPEEMGEDVQWGVHFVDNSDTTIEELIRDIGQQFGADRTEVRECVYLDGTAAIKVSVTTTRLEDWYSESIFLEHQGTIYRIGNGAVRDDLFEAFYGSFHLE
jgi:hypothetical protein